MKKAIICIVEQKFNGTVFSPVYGYTSDLSHPINTVTGLVLQSWIPEDRNEGHIHSHSQNKQSM